MAAKNRTVTYAPAATVAEVLQALFDELTDGAQLGWTSLEDRIDEDGHFLVQHQDPAEAKSQMILRFKHALISSVNYIGVTAYTSWAVGTPGSGTDPTLVCDIDSSNTSEPAKRFHEIDLTSGGRFWLDGDDAGLWLAIHSGKGATPETSVNALNQLFGVCNIESSLYPNYGVLMQQSNRLEFTADNYPVFWQVPRNHDDGPSSSNDPTFTIGNAVYVAMPPLWAYTTNGGNRANTGPPGLGADTYNNVDLVQPIFVGNMHQGLIGTSSSLATRAIGYRGVLHGLKFFNQGANLGFRAEITANGVSYIVLPAQGVASTDKPYFLVPKAA